MDPEQEQPQSELQPTEQELQRQLATVVAYTANAIRLGIAAFTGGLSKVGEFLWGLIASRVVGGLSFGGLHGPSPIKKGGFGVFSQKHKISLLLLCLVAGVVLLPLLFIFMSLFSAKTGLRDEPLAPISHP